MAVLARSAAVAVAMRYMNVLPDTVPDVSLGHDIAR
jgi:hypothetical protein